MIRTTPPDALEWPSAILGAMYEDLYGVLRELNAEGASRWKVAALAAQWALSDGDSDQFKKWDDRAERLEALIREGRWDDRQS